MTILNCRNGNKLGILHKVVNYDFTLLFVCEIELKSLTDGVLKGANVNTALGLPSEYIHSELPMYIMPHK
jgi:hypothetical protein